MSKTVRIHTLAKELNVNSKDILDKCAAEGIEVKNHMAAISLGLAESIREWFSVAADHHTTVEVAGPVDLGKVRKPRRSRAKSAESDADVGESHDVAVEVVAPTEAPPPSAEPEPEVEIDQPVEMQPEPVLEPAPEPVTEIAADVEAAPVEAPLAPIEERVAPIHKVSPGAVPLPPPPARPVPPRLAPAAPPKPPEPPPRPAGPQLVPKPAELKGPRVVRIERPDSVPAPRPRPAASGAAPAAGTSFAGGRDGRGRRGVRGKEEESEAARARALSPRRQGRVIETVTERLREWRDQDVIERQERLASATGHGIRDRRVAEKRRSTAPAAPAGPAQRKAAVELTCPLSVKAFSAAVGVPFQTIFAKLLEQTGKAFTVNQMLDAETVELLALELNLSIEIARARTALERVQDDFAERERKHVQPRPPVVAMLGHVDHGKTSLLDAIRRSNVAAGEAGGITQHIGAHRIDRGDWHVTFLDTPGHEAFTAMRAQGANLTDVVVLVIAADDGPMPQTIEALNHARAAKVPVVVALNKIDLPGVDLNRVYSKLAEIDLTPTEWGGQTDLIKTSATTGVGVDDLLAHLSTLSELLDLKADSTVPAQATVIEAQMREGRGGVAQVLVREGTLKSGQFFVCGPAAGKVRSLVDSAGNRMTEAGPGTPVEVTGLDELPRAGDQLFVLNDLARAKEIAAEIRQQRREEALTEVRKPQTLADLLSDSAHEEIPSLNVIVRADVQGSVEVLRKALGDFPKEKARLNVLHAGVGTISEADVRLAQASSAVVIGFHVIAEDRARQLADQVGVDIRIYRVIYEIIDDLHKALAGLLSPEEREEARGRVEVRQVFNVTRVGTIAGCAVIDGVVARSHRLRLVRDGRIVLEGAAIASLKRFKDDAREVRAGFECGIKIEGFDDVKPGDVLESYDIVEVAQTL
ncbi:MAG: translation initiation factor IF-2 [Phycisphaerae bacterium]